VGRPVSVFALLGGSYAARNALLSTSSKKIGSFENSLENGYMVLRLPKLAT
jgi:hypothetical protein